VAGYVAERPSACGGAMMRGERGWCWADALAEAIPPSSGWGRVSGYPYRLAGQLGMPPLAGAEAQKQAPVAGRATRGNRERVVASSTPT